MYIVHNIVIFNNYTTKFKVFQFQYYILIHLIIIDISTSTKKQTTGWQDRCSLRLRSLKNNWVSKRWASTTFCAKVTLICRVIVRSVILSESLRPPYCRITVIAIAGTSHCLCSTKCSRNSAFRGYVYTHLIWGCMMPSIITWNCTTSTISMFNCCFSSCFKHRCGRNKCKRLWLVLYITFGIICIKNLPNLCLMTDIACFSQWESHCWYQW